MNFNDNKAIYLQIADQIMDGIVDGTYPPGGRIPSVREFAASVEVNANTVMRSYEHLERDGIIFNRRGIGFFVADDAIEIVSKARSDTFFDDELPYFLSRLSSLGISPEELINIYQSYLSKQKK
ncbi:MAG: GntR family transcriptional regulator [Paramuribaculum sp.]|nr:GntR family transcriptional regulator [Paramuribaculum sp.]